MTTGSWVVFAATHVSQGIALLAVRSPSADLVDYDLLGEDGYRHITRRVHVSNRYIDIFNFFSELEFFIHRKQLSQIHRLRSSFSTS